MVRRVVLEKSVVAPGFGGTENLLAPVFLSIGDDFDSQHVGQSFAVTICEIQFFDGDADVRQFVFEFEGLFASFEFGRAGGFGKIGADNSLDARGLLTFKRREADGV